MSRLARLAVVVGALALTGCLKLHETWAPVEIPRTEGEMRRIQPRDLQRDAVTEPESIEDGLAEIAKRTPEEPPELETKTLGLDDIRAIVLERNLDLQVRLVDPELARVRVSEEEGRFDAVIGGRFDFRHSELPKLDGPLVDFTSPDPSLDGAVVKLTELEQEKETLDFGFDLTVPLPTGGKFKVESLWAKDNLYDPARFEQYLTATRFSLSQPLMRGAGPEVTFGRVRLAKVDERIVQGRTQLSALRLLAAAEKAYWRLYAAQRALEIRRDQYEIAYQNLEFVRQRVEQGLSAAIEIVRAEVGVASRLELLVISETRWRLRQRELKAILNAEDLPLAEGPWITVGDDPRLAGLELDRDLLVREALQNRLELIELELSLLQDSIAIGLAENDVLPLVNLEFEYGTFERDQSFGSAWNNQWEFENQVLGVGVSVQFPVRNQERQARLEESLLTRARRLATQDARELAVRREVLDAVDLLEQNWQRILASRQNAIVSGLNYQGELRQFQEGFRTMREVLEALSELGTAQLREVAAMVDYQVSQIDVAFATGTLMGYSRVSL